CESRRGGCVLAYPKILRHIASSRLSLSLFVAFLCVPRVGVIHGNQSCAERQGLSAGQNQVAETQAQHGFVPQCCERLLLFGFGQFTLKPCTRRYDYGAVAPVRWYSDGRRESVSGFGSPRGQRGIERRANLSAGGNLVGHNPRCRGGS